MRTYSLILVSLLFTIYLPFISSRSPEEEPEPPGDLFHRWRAADNAFSGWTLDGVRLAADGRLEMDVETAHLAPDPFKPGTYHGGNFYNGGTHLIGEATSPTPEP